MINVYREEEALSRIRQYVSRSTRPTDDIVRSVAGIIDEVRRRGDEGLRDVAARIGDEVASSFEMEEKEAEDLAARVPADRRMVLERAASNIRAFAERVAALARPVHLERSGFSVGLDFRPVRRAACYVPAGRFPLPSSALMTTITARAAGVEEVLVVSPRPSPEIVFAGRLAGVSRFFRIGGAQAVAALAFGTESVPRVDVVCGPGNAYVSEAKRQLQGEVGIDILAGPSEVVIVADDSADVKLVALDLLAQAEHDPDAVAILMTTSTRLADFIPGAVAEAQAVLFPAGDGSVQSIGSIEAFLIRSLTECARASNEIGPEHLQLHLHEADAAALLFDNYGALFLGAESGVVFGDYIAGPNHTLPTSGASRFSGCLSPLHFLRPQSWIRMGTAAASLAEDTALLADTEGLRAHAASARARAGLTHAPAE
jgi:histidinol dehydrogenase